MERQISGVLTDKSNLKTGGKKVPTKIWISINEPRFVTILIIMAYSVAATSGILIIDYSLNDNGQLYEPLAISSGVALIISGVIGIPVAWSGKHWIERGIALGLSLAGGLVTLTLSVAYWVHHSLYSFGVDALFEVTWSLMPIIFGLNRFERCRLTPYTVGKGPLLPEHRKSIAQAKMDDDWEKAVSDQEE